MPPTSPEQASARPPHPLAGSLIAALGGAAARVVDFAAGSGRNARALREAGLTVLAVDDGAATRHAGSALGNGPYRALLSTHGFLHGTPASLAATLDLVADALEPGGLLFATFGSTEDARFGTGTELEPFVYAPDDGDERGVPHIFFDADRLRELLERHFAVDLMEERDADETAGAWAHREKPLSGSVHWFVQARKR
jgi:hypothetical protein